MPTLTFRDRFGPTAVLNAAPLAMSDEGSSVGTTGLSVGAGARFALRERQAEKTSFTPTASLLARMEGLSTPGRMGLGLEARVGLALTRPTRVFFPFAELYALTAIGFAGRGFAPTEAWLRLGAGLQFNFYTWFTRSYTVGDLVMAFMGAIGGYFRVLSFGGSWGGGGGGGAGAVMLVVALIALVVVPPVAILAGMVATLGVMVANVEVAWSPSLNGRTPAVTELRLGVGF